MIDEYEPKESLLDGGFSCETTEDWDMSEVNLIHGDCLTEMKLIPDASVEYVLNNLI